LSAPKWCKCLKNIKLLNLFFSSEVASRNYSERGKNRCARGGIFWIFLIALNIHIWMISEKYIKFSNFFLLKVTLKITAREWKNWHYSSACVLFIATVYGDRHCTESTLYPPALFIALFTVCTIHQLFSVASCLRVVF
jgi:hypothetical protein